MCCGNKTIVSNPKVAKAVRAATNEKGLVRLRYTGKETMSDWSVPGSGRSYRFGAERREFYAYPDDVETVLRWKQRGVSVLELVKPEPPAEEQDTKPLAPVTIEIPPEEPVTVPETQVTEDTEPPTEEELEPAEEDEETEEEPPVEDSAEPKASRRRKK